MNWSDYPNFTEDEFMCKHTGELFMQIDFMEKLQALRTEYGKPMIVTSGFRSVEHPLEAAKTKPGVHTLGCAADIAIGPMGAYEIAALAFKHGFTGIGISQRDGQPRFIHLDTWSGFPRPNMWSY